MRLLIVGAIALLIPAWSSTQQPETLSLLEKPLYRPPVSKGERTRLAAEIEAARKAVAAEPSNPEAVLRLAQAQMALGALGEAMISLSRAIEGNVDDPRLRLARGHGFIDIRKFDLAIRDFRNAAATIPAARLRRRVRDLPDGRLFQGAPGICRMSRPGIFRLPGRAAVGCRDR